MVSPSAPAPLVRASGTCAPHWPEEDTYLHRHPELAAVIPRQTAIPRGGRSQLLKGTVEPRQLRPTVLESSGVLRGTGDGQSLRENLREPLSGAGA